jgi:dienelactone hydrolase
MKYASAAIAGIALFASSLHGAIKTQTVNYEQGGTHLQGFLAYDDSLQGKRPGIIVCPEWWGLTDYAKHRAQMLAGLGYVALAVDLYGDGKTTEDPQEAGKLAGALKSNRALLRERVNAGLAELKKNEFVDPEKTGAIGYCFGGTTAIELGRSGADVKGIVTFHAGFTSEKDLNAFEQEMRENHVDWEINIYGGAVHSFTNPGADKHGIPGIAYNATADRRSWQAMQTFFHNLFTPSPTGK